MRQSDELGENGEDQFRILARSAEGVKFSQSNPDKLGWDFYVEIQQSNTQLPLDMQPASLNCFVQVKSTESNRRSIPIKLSNALRFSQRKEPCFLVLFIFEEDCSTPTYAYVKHFWEELLERTAKRVRRADVAGNGDFINREYLEVRFLEEDKVEVDSIFEKIKSHIEGVDKNYSELKNNKFFYSGFDEGLGGGVSFSEEVTHDDLVDLALGFRDSLPVKDFYISSKRFGMEMPMPPFGDEGKRFIGGEVSLEVKPFAIGRMQIVGRELEIPSFPIEVYTPGAFPNIPTEKKRFRFRNSFIDICTYVDPKQGLEIEYGLENQIKLPISSLIGCFSLLERRSGEPCIFRIWLKQVIAFEMALPRPRNCNNFNTKSFAPHLAFLKLIYAFRDSGGFPDNFELSIDDLNDSLLIIQDFYLIENCEYLLAVIKDHQVDGEFRFFHSLSGRVGDKLITLLYCFEGSYDEVVEIDGVSYPKIFSPVVLNVIFSNFNSDVEGKFDSEMLTHDLNMRQKIMEQKFNVKCYKGDVLITDDQFSIFCGIS